MHTATATLSSVSAYSQSRAFTDEKGDKETHKDFEQRIWRERMHATSDGYVFIPPMCFKNCTSEIAKYLTMQIPGKGKSTYTKHFEAGILVIEPIVLPDKKAEVEGEWLHVPSDGKRGGDSRVWKCFPIIRQWKGNVVFTILDDTITKEVFAYHLEEAGKFIGVGRFRPRKNGYYGRFGIDRLVWN